ncbi:RNAse E [Actibacterium atlanticum]|uniref:Ribonuclease E n=1 Tax=Actibacterium atlanticum TaxID=1461693 RepID=A0A058ZQ85_9RHOB|nr:ribonuclease E/G [Actibacterium atlanticum]KCV83714.1 RNAse E [Actibacterium atlanticum]
MAKKMLIDATHAEETRVVVVDGNKVDEFDFESVNKRQLAGNIYLAKITRVEPSLQAAFVDYGGNRHGFLAFSEIHPDYYQIPVADREALLEDERAYAKAMAEDDEKPSGGRSRRRRSRSRSKAKPETAAETAEANVVETAESIPGMDVVDLTDDASAADVADAVVDTPEDAPVQVAEAAPVDTVEDTAVEADPVAVAEAEVEAPVEVAEAPEASDDTSDEDKPGPQTMAAKISDTEDQVVTAEVSDETDTASDTEAETDAGEETTEESAEETPEVETAQDDAPQEPNGESSEDAEDEALSHASERDEDIESVAEEDVTEEIRTPRKPRPKRYKIQEVIKVRQILLVQVVKEERGNKGAALTTYLSLAGRYCVLMPNTARGGGISRKITNATDRKKLKEIAGEISVPEGAGLIIRTAGAKRTKSEIKRDYEYLMRLWEQIRELTLKSVAPAPIYEEGNLIKRTIRDLYNREIDEVLVEGEAGYRVAKDFMKMIMPSHAKNVKQYTDPLPLFARYQVESYLGSMFNPTVQLKSGGYIVIGVTEALVAIDVNSGRATKEGSIEETALKTNLEAAEEVARQLRLRDLAGLIVIDFIDMEERRNNTAVEKRMKDKLKTDRARIQVGRISGFGLMEMSRQRLRPGMIEATTQPCPHCHGTGLLRSDDNLALQILRQLEEEGVRGRTKEVLIKAPIGIVNFLINQKREHIAQIEARYGISVRVEADPMLISPDYHLERFKTATRSVPEVTAPVISIDTSDMPEIEEAEVVGEPTSESEETPAPKKRRRRRRRRRSSSSSDAQTTESTEDTASEGEAGTEAEAPAEASEEGSEEKPKSSRSRRRRSRSRSRKTTDETPTDTAAESEQAAEASPEAEADTPAEAEEVAPEAVPTEVAPVAEEEAPVEDTADAPAEVVEAPAEDTPHDEVAQTEETAPETPAEPEPAPEPEEPVLETAEQAPAEPPKPKRRGWWSR